MTQRQYELPVDIRRKSEVVQDRIGLVIVMGVVAIFTFLLFLLSVNMGFILAKGAAALPDVSLLENWRPQESTRIYDRSGILIANIHGDEDRVVVPLKEISPNVQRAVMATEDTRFYEHGGVDFRGTIRALAQNMKGGDIQGGSTVTQQLVKNLFLTPERSISRKIAEALLAMRVEQYYEKDRIMELYLNQVYWGNQSYGIEKAARRYFKKPASDLTIAESALLAGLLKAPEGLSPYAYPEAARSRQLEVLGKMLENGYITQKQYRASVNQEIELNRRTPQASKHPYFITHVVQELEERYGSDVVRRGGLKVYTTMDDQVQTAAEQALESQIKSLPKYSSVSQGALVSISVETGEILALVGGIDFEKNQFNNATQARRAVGSTFKPFVYLTAFRQGLITPESTVVDRPVSFNTGYSIWNPKNWDGKFMGAMTARKALALSRNTTTVQIGMKVGIDPVIETARLAGVESNIDRNFSSLLGSAGVSPLELATAYSTLAREGVYLKPSALLRVEDARGHEIPLERAEPERRFDPEPISNLVSILVDVVENGTGRSAKLEDRQVAGKTGTTDQVRDIWFAGFTPDMVAIVWMGNEKYVPLRGVFSSNAAQVWGDFAKAYYKINPVPASKFPEAQPILVEKKVVNTNQNNNDAARPAGNNEAGSPPVPVAANSGEPTNSGHSTDNPPAQNVVRDHGVQPLIPATTNGRFPTAPRQDLKPLVPVSSPSGPDANGVN